MEPDPEQQAFVDATMAPLGDQPLARKELEGALADASTFPPGGDTLEIATLRMEKTAASFVARNTIWILLTLVVALASSWFAIAGPPAWRSLREIVLANRMMAALSSMCCSYRTVPDFPRWTMGLESEDEDPFKNAILKRTTPQNRSLLFGDLSYPDEVERWKRVWDEHPKDSRHYLAYSLKYHKAHSSWPPGFVETGERLDPGNGWFRLIAGANKAKDAMGVPAERKFSREERRAARAAGKELVRSEEKRPEIINAAKADESMVLLREALAMPRLDDYRRSLKTLRFQATPPVTDLASHCEASLSVWSHPEVLVSEWLSIRDYSQLLSVLAADAAKRGDRKQLGEIRDLAVLLSRRLGEIPQTLLPRFVTSGVMSGSGKALAQAWADLGEPERAKEFEAVVWKLDRKTSPAPAVPHDALDEYRGSGAMQEIYLGNRGPGSTPVVEAEIRGGRLAEHSLYERFMLHVAAALLSGAILYLAIASVIQWRRSGFLADRLAGLLIVQDWIRIFLLGVVLPMGLYAFVTRSSLFASREFTLGEDRFYMWLIQTVTFAALIILGTLHTSVRCLGRRGNALALGWPGFNLGRWIMPLAIVGMAVGQKLLDLVPYDDFFRTPLWVSLGTIAALPWLWIAVIANGRIAPAGRMLHRATLMRVMLPILSVAMVPIALAIPAVHREERYWVSLMDYDAVKAETNLFFPRAEREYGDWIGERTRRALNEMKLIPRD